MTRAKQHNPRDASPTRPAHERRRIRFGLYALVGVFFALALPAALVNAAQSGSLHRWIAIPLVAGALLPPIYGLDLMIRGLLAYLFHISAPELFPRRPRRRLIRLVIYALIAFIVALAWLKDSGVIT